MRHRWEEPAISGHLGSEAVFFSGCNLRCVFCQNSAISRDSTLGTPYTVQEFASLLLKLAKSNAHTISLISPAHHAPEIAAALRIAQEAGLSKPVVYNTNGYESTTALRLLEGLVDVYLPDFKYDSDSLALRYSGALGYHAAAIAAIGEMIRQQPDRIYNKEGLLQKGVLIRHLVLPGCRHDSMAVMKEISCQFPNAAVSLLRQYTPAFLQDGFPKLNRTVTTFEYESVKEQFFDVGLRDGYQQEKESATARYTPEFEQVLPKQRLMDTE
jgi:putative pyruvate formate lyase activating enzyme